MHNKSMHSITWLTAILLVIFLALPSCASRGGKTYSDDEVRTPQEVRYGTISNISEVMVADDPKGIGAIIGGTIGGISASFLGGGSARIFTAIGGALVGGLFGSAVESETRKYKATELTIDLDTGGTVVVVQGNDEYFTPGDKVRILIGANSTRIQHAQ